MTDRKSRFIARQSARLAARRIDRRDFVRSLMAAGLSVPAALTLADRAAAQTPQRGGLFRMGMSAGSTTDSLDPGTYENEMTIHMGYVYGSMLTAVAEDGRLEGEVAESFEPIDGGRAWAFRIRPGMEFHNGKTVTADDVIASINHHRGPDATSAAKGPLTPVTDIRKDGDATVIFELDAPNADFPFIVSDYHLVILPAEDGEIDPQSGIGTGPYVIDRFDPGVRFEASRFANYYREDRAHFDAVSMLALPDVTARQTALLNGEVDVIDQVDPKTVALLSRAPQVQILEVTGTLHYTFPMRLDTPPFDDYNLRMALKLSVDRQELLDKILLGHGALGNDHPISPANRFHASALPQREYDPDQARFHYERSGHSGPIPLSASESAFAGAVDAAQLIQSGARAAGIEIEVIREPSDGYWTNVWNKKGWCASYWGGRPTEDWMFTSGYTDDTEWNDTAWVGTEASARFNELVRAARAELDATKRAEMYAECQRLIHDDGGAIIPMFANYILGLGRNVRHGETVAANWSLDGHKAHERWWFG